MDDITTFQQNVIRAPRCRHLEATCARLTPQWQGLP
jgi:hypothetical protein